MKTIKTMGRDFTYCTGVFNRARSPIPFLVYIVLTCFTNESQGNCRPLIDVINCLNNQQYLTNNIGI